MKSKQRGIVFLPPLILAAALAVGLTAQSWPAQAFSVDANTKAQVQASNAGWNLSALPLAKFTHDDLQSAAAYATSNGYPARAAVYTAIDTQLTACENAISASAPKLPAAGSVGVFTAYEVAAETVGNGIPAAVRINCSAVTLP